MDITILGLQNAGKTSLVRVLAVGSPSLFIPNNPLIYYLSGWRIHNRLPTNRRLQHEKSTEGTCDTKVVCRPILSKD